VEGAPTGSWKLNTSSGGITVRLPDGASFEVDAHTSSGSISTDFPITVQGVVANRRELRGKVREGGPLLDLDTSSGSIRIESQSGRGRAS
jgi:lia operon protein LiaG